MTDSNITLIGSTPQDILLGSSTAMTIQNKSKSETVNVKIQGSSATGGEIPPMGSGSFGTNITAWVQNPRDGANIKVELYVVKN